MSTVSFCSYFSKKFLLFNPLLFFLPTVAEEVITSRMCVCGGSMSSRILRCFVCLFFRFCCLSKDQIVSTCFLSLGLFFFFCCCFIVVVSLPMFVGE